MNRNLWQRLFDWFLKRSYEQPVGRTPAGLKSSPPLSNKQRAGRYAAAVVAMIGVVIAVEGGYVNHPNDPGGETNMGVTKRVAVENGYSGPMRSLPREVVENIYYDRYIVGHGLEPLIELDAAVTEELFDTGVNMGPGRPSRWFQASLNRLCNARLAVDGQIGPATVRAFGQCQQRAGAATLCRSMLDSLDRLQRAEYDRLARNPRLRVFHRGWVAHRIGNVDRRKCGRA